MPTVYASTRPITDGSIPTWDHPAFVIRLRGPHTEDYCGCGEEVEVPGLWVMFNEPDHWHRESWTTIHDIHRAARFASWDDALKAIDNEWVLDPEQRHEAVVEEFEPRHRAPDGRPVEFVNVYRTCQVYGGPEEGGWWYTAAEVMFSVPCHNRVQAETVQERLLERFPRDPSGWGRDERHSVVIEDHEGISLPRTRPHYC